ncbi:metal-dependent hydrolase [Bernardetia litoralis DSM 6794]|uniref:Metal-dependent hydrolase n=1 Tax=Bernardetia litoralis (strain ATCC 23117 / DSM 6794 / NBRC 15988 / NCIMB 1366 / Fx l1 / Sio-4) TaxID=880071 RepID=I4ALP5_BERLS|nr:endonuclease/exonuclease/phosphatase family protein [Bernardetia litoralis]AFM04880.1 metal-dependent hydrolase [Bernardetia litoralis DSM 6794]
MKKNILLFFSIFVLFASATSSCSSSEQSSNNNKRPNTPILSDNSDGKDKNVKAETIKILSWNLYNFGKSKDAQEIEYIAKKLKDYDIVAIQEVSTSLYGIRAVAKLADELNRTGSKWEYKISEPTSGNGKERYAYVWKTSTKNAKILLKKDWLEESIEAKVDREPYMARFEIESKSTKNTVLLGSFHAVPTSKDPEKEVVFLEEIPNKYRTDNILIMGDFNLSQKHEAFDGLRERSFVAAFEGQKTSLRMKLKDGNPLNKEYDNIFVEKRGFEIKKAEVIHFYKDYKSLKEARYISDHIPIWVELDFK